MAAVRTRRVVRSRAAVLAASLVIVSCTSSGSDGTTTVPATTATVTTTRPPTPAPTTTVASTTTVHQGLIAALPECEDGAALAPPGITGQVSFLTGGVLYVADPNGDHVQCVGEVSTSHPLVWGPVGDRLIAGEVVIAEGASAPFPTAAQATWSRPTGTSLVWVDGGRLFKSASGDAQARDLTFLARHDAVTYHPAGIEIASIGEADDGTLGVWLTSNEGADPRLIVRAEEATVHEFTFTHDGVSAFFLADHDGHWHVHDIFLVLPEDDPSANEFDATIRFESSDPLSNLVVSPWGGLWAAQEGSCGSGSRVVTGEEFSLPRQLTEVEGFPVGWLPGPRLVVASYPDGCGQPADLWVVDASVDGVSSVDLLVSGVEGAAIRAALPEPPGPLGASSLDDFA